MHRSLTSLQRVPYSHTCRHTLPGRHGRHLHTDSRIVSRGILDSYRQGKSENASAAQIATDLKLNQGGASVTDEGCRTECVTQIFSQTEFDEALLNASPRTLVVVDFYNKMYSAGYVSQDTSVVLRCHKIDNHLPKAFKAFRTACGSCRYIQPGFAKLCRNSGDHHAAVIFLKHNIIDEYDEPSDLAEGLKIKAVPQFDFYLGGQLVERFATREKARIADAINKHAGEGTVVLSEIDRSLGQPAKP